MTTATSSESARGGDIAILEEAPAGGPASEDVDVVMSAIAGQDDYILSQGQLEVAGFRFTSSLVDGPWIITPRRVIYPLGRATDLRPRLHGVFAANGLFRVCTPEVSTVSLLVDGGATFHVAGARWASRLRTLPGCGVSARGVGQNIAPSLGRGMLTLRFAPAPELPTSR